jgi:hypothetical protein
MLLANGARADQPGFDYRVTVWDPREQLTRADHDALVKCATGGLEVWRRWLTGKGVLTVEIRIQATPNGRFGGASSSNVRAGACHDAPKGCVTVEEQGLHRLRTGENNPERPNAPDMHVDVDPAYWRKEVWADPDPLARTAPVPKDRLDCVSLFIHELDHGFGMTGFRSLSDFRDDGRFRSLYDDLVRFDKGALTFNGTHVVAELGPLPLTSKGGSQNVYHYANPGDHLPIDDLLMNGITYHRGHRYDVGRVDVLILEDLGAPVRALPDK